jgi:hypothetical protein
MITQNMITILDSKINIIGKDLYDHFSHAENLHLDDEQDFT